VVRFEKEDTVEENLVRSIQNVGPRNIALLSRQTGSHPETIRYKVKKQFKKLGIAIHAEVDYRKLGLIPFWADLRFSSKFGGGEHGVLSALNRFAYLVYCGRLLPQGSFACMFAVPDGKRSQHQELLSSMKRSGVLEGFTLSETVADRINKMNPKFFNFQSGTWEINWGDVKKSSGTELKPTGVAPSARVDAYDLLLVKELQIDSLQHLVSIAKKVKVHSKTLEYHYRAHVLAQGLISGYRLRWVHDIERPIAHSVLLTQLVFRNLGRGFRTVQRAISRIPFLWAEYLYKDGTYVAILNTPVREAVTTLEYLNSEARNLHGRVELSYLKRSEANLYTVPHELFKDGWTYDLKKAKSEAAGSR
jgi:DNA-binding Lrp family transcriptional regulator